MTISNDDYHGTRVIHLMSDEVLHYEVGKTYSQGVLVSMSSASCQYTGLLGAQLEFVANHLIDGGRGQ